MQKRVLSGMRPTGRLHLGNYLGAAKGMLALQENEEFETFFTVVDIHAITTPYDAKTLPASARDVFIDYLSIGLDPQKSAISVQSDLTDLITQLSFYFSSVMTVARMQHLPTFKDKVRQHPDNVTMALLNYPLLMAADILIYKASKVPVGIDQEPHLEIAREIARKMNDKFGLDFPEPTRFATKGEYIPSLLGEGKMSKSIEGSAIELGDDLKTIVNKLKKAPTDNGRGDDIPTKGGVANLLHFVELFEGIKKRRTYELAYMGVGIRYGDLKKDLAQAIFKELEPIQARRKELEANPKYVNEMMALGAKKSREIAEKTLAEVRAKMGLR
jgi:tryptophanyl-tRNA synthetase